MTIHVGVGGASKAVPDIHVGVGGAWKRVQEAYVGVGGAWKRFHIFSTLPVNFAMTASTQFSAGAPKWRGFVSSVFGSTSPVNPGVNGAACNLLMLRQEIYSGPLELEYTGDTLAANRFTSMTISGIGTFTSASASFSANKWTWTGVGFDIFTEGAVYNVTFA